MSRNIVYKAQIGTYLDEAVKEACEISKALGSADLYAYLMIDYNGIQIGINELSDPDITIGELKEKIRMRYERQNNN